MDVIDRKSAKEFGLTKFFSGKACKQGHFSERYVSTGGCLSCINSPVAKVLRNVRQKAYTEQNREVIIARQKVYRDKNPELLRQRKKLYASNNKEKIAEASKIYREENLGRLREYDRKRHSTPEAKASRNEAYKQRIEGFVGPKKPRSRQSAEAVKAKRAASWAKYYARHKERLAARKLEYVSENREAYLFGQKRWRENNTAARTALQAKRSAMRTKSVPEWFGELDRFVWIEAAHLAILRLKSTGIPWQCDHMIPILAKTACGLHVAGNCQVIPAYLNLRKNNKLIFTEPFEWMSHV